MIFKGEPNLYVKLSNKVVQRVTGLKGFYFDDKGEYNTDNELMIKVLSQNFESIEDTQAEKKQSKKEIKPVKQDYKYNCKHCSFGTNNKGELLAHYRTHKKE